LIQLSTPIQTANPVQIGVHETEGNRVEGPSDDSSGHLEQAEKKNGPGIFAKLLESLTAKRKAAESEDAENTGDKLLPESELTNTSNQLLPEHMALSIEQTTEQTPGLSFEESMDLSIEQLGDLSIAPLIEPGIWAEAEKTLVPEEPESISDEINLMEALLARDHAARQAGAEEVQDEEVPKGRELVRPGEIPSEVALKDEGPVESGELSVATVPPEEADEAQALKAKANEESAKLADKKARSFMADSSRQTEEDISRLKYQTASLGAKPAGENGEGRRGNSTAAESRGKKSRDRINVEFLDLRTESPMETGNVRGVVLSAQGQTPLKSELEISVDLNPKSANTEAGKAGNETYQSRAFEDALATQLRGDLSMDIVRDATVIARNGGEGTIRLTLHPASLGNVKVRLEMAENKITALIVVESDEALRAFQRELPVLEKAFKDSGFSETNLQMSLAQDERNYGGSEDRRERDFSALAPVMAASRYEADSGLIETLLPVNGETVSSAWPERIPVNLLI
jgi:flagellar hook-length control protein FliK